MEIFQDKIVIVTGAASGIGRAVCEQMAEKGAKLVMADINESLLKEAAASINKGGHYAKPVVLDVRDFNAFKKMADDTIAEHGRLDYIFNNAGVGVMGEARFFEYDDWKKVIDINLYGVVNGVAAAYPLMVKQGFGHIVNTSSLAGIVPTPVEVSYVASKYAVVGLSNALRIEGEALGVKVSVVCPGLIDTPIQDAIKLIKVDKEQLKTVAPKFMPVKDCAREILAGVEKNKAIILITGLTKISWVLQRLSPGLIRWIWKNNLKKFRELY